MTQHDEALKSGHGEEAHTSVEKEVAQAIGGLKALELLKNWTPFFVGLVVALIIGWLIWPTLLYSKKSQPAPFNHLVHTEEVGLACDDCHSFNDAGRFSGVPKGEQCIECHTWSDRQNEDSKAEAAFLEKFVNDDDELKAEPEWLIYSKQPDCVFFSHIAHVEMGGLECSECHGNHGESTELRPYYENRITKYSRDTYDKMKMNDCADCHTKHDKPENNACFVCHK
jgi:hypothetical protein